MTRVSLVTGADASTREAAMAELAASGIALGWHVAAILEGFAARPAEFPPKARVVRLAPGCPCCTGQLAMRVTLDRLLRQPLDLIVIGLANVAHAGTLQNWLAQAPYDRLLTVSECKSL